MTAVVVQATGPVLVQATTFSGIALAFWRLWFGVVAIGVALLLVWRNDRRGRRWSATGVKLALLAGLAFGMHQLFFFSAIKLTSVADVVIIETLVPLTVAGISSVWLKRSYSARLALWGVVAASGAAVIAFSVPQRAEGDVLGVGFAFLHVAMMALFLVLSEVARRSMATLPFLLTSMGCASMLVTLVGMSAGEALLSARATDYLFAAIIAVGPGLLGWGLIAWALSSVPALVPALARLTTPFISSVLAWWILSEALSVEHAIGAALTCIGVAAASVVMYRETG